MSCNATIMKSSVTEALRRSVGTNDTLYASYLSEVVDDDNFTSDFKNWCKDKYGHELNYDSDNNIEETVKAITRYYNEKHPDINFSSRIQNDSTTVGRFGYTSVAAREFAKRVSANFMLDFYHQLAHDMHEKIDGSKKAYYADAVTSRMEEILADRIATKTGMSEDDVFDIIDSDNAVAQLEELLKDAPIQDKNVLATYKEMLGDREGFFTYVFLDSRLGELRFENDESLDSDITQANLENQDIEDSDSPSEEENNAAQADDKDNSINNLNNKDGQYNNFMTHIDMSVRSYLSSLKKLHSGHTTDNSYDYNTDNDLGIPDCMNADECCAVLYSYADFTNVASMKNSIREIANNIPGFAAFHQMADYLDQNDDFAYEVYRTFGKTVISKMETVVEGGVGKARTSNRRADKLTSLRFEYLNSAKATSILLDDLNSKFIYDSLKAKIDDYVTLRKDAEQYQSDKTMDVADRMALLDEADKNLTGVIADLAAQLRRYYPTIEDAAIANYVMNSHNQDVAGNLANLATILKETINASYVTQQNYHSRQAEIGKAWAHNKAIDTKKAEGIPTTETYEDLSALYAQDYVDASTQTTAFKLANELVHYTMVKTELNSRNVHGNQSSDVINNSMITNVINTLKSQTSLENYGKYKSQSRQYDFSNIIVEHRDEKGNIINFGLFTQDPVSQDFKPTPYAQRLLHARLFSGASDMITSSNVLYSEMSKGDYVATGFINFFNVEEDYNDRTEGDKITFANYFMRIPSDAPKNFIMTAPKYSVGETRYGANDGLFHIENQAEANKEVYKKINGLNVIGEENAVLGENAPSRTLKQLLSNVTSKSINNITLSRKNVINETDAKTGDDITVNFKHTAKDGVETEYVLKGKLAKDNGRFILQQPEFVGFVGNTKSSEVIRALEKHYQKELIKSGVIKRAINTEHPIYKQFRNIFVQEITDAATALDRIFQTRDGYPILDDNGHPVFREGFANDKTTARRLYAIYHVGKGKNILDNGKLTGSVFSSDRFKITHTDEHGNVSERNYGKEIINEAFDFLYGGATNKYIHVAKGAKGTTVTLTEEQENKVQEKLTEFINDYINDTQERISQYSEFIDENLITDDNVAEFALNHHLMYVSFNDLFEGDTKFYKDTQTFLKRAKESQGSGVPYGLVDYNMDLSAPRTQVMSRLNQKIFTRKFADGHTENVEIGQYNKFRGVTIKNTIRTSVEVAVKDVDGAKEDGAVTKNLIKALQESGMTKTDAESKARSMMKGYHHTTVNDAQSYITFEEWVRRVSARGQLEKYMPLIKAVLDETKPLDAKAIGEFIQVQKNFYYDQHYNAELGVVVPRQIKNAEFVLVPRLIQGTQLEQVYNMMKQNGIDQLNTEETSKAGKANVLTIWDNDGNITQENIDDFNNNAAQATELYNYNYLYTQQETPQHVDNENKAGIQIMKKMLDNITPDSKLYPIKQKFFQLYSANIKESFADLIDELNLETDENGNIKLDETGNIKGLNYQLFFDRLQEEVARLGLDSNMMDYVTLAETQMFDASTGGVVPVTIMPTYMSNVSTKLESIAQSMFNSRITRQKLPGFHAAQITNIGWSAANAPTVYKLTNAGQGKGFADTITEKEYKKLAQKNKMYYTKTKGGIGTSKELKYHPDGKSYIEILLPKSNFKLNYKKADGTLKTDDELLKELQDSGLDTMIGYRIPTEGKQSVCIMKLKGFTDDALGSTIVVPDDWVSQTGSDFDIDSVYGINFAGRVNKITNRAEKIKYRTDTTEQDYFSYLRHKLNHKFDTKVKDTIENLKKAVEEERNEAYQSLMETESELYHALPDEVRDKIKELQQVDKKGKTPLKVYTQQNNQVIDGLTQYINNAELSDDVKSQIQQYIDARTNINTFINNSTKEDQKKYAEGKTEILKERLNKIEAMAKKAGLPTYTQFQAMPEIERNTRDARNNQILQSMIDILSSPEALEENLSRSNFEDIIIARDSAIDPNVKKRREQRSPYNFFDQAEYQEDVMSGAKLKAFSVTRDTFCSICNTVRPTISKSHEVKVLYMKRDGYKKEALSDSFDNIEVINKGKEDEGYVVTHNTFGWSKNNKNAAGKILTAYSSQTTAHILDAVKEGAIPNVNDLTFQVYKCFPDFGADYDTGVRFIMQPGIGRIVEAYNSNKSIYSRGSKNPVHTAIRSIAKELLAQDGLELNDRESIDVIINKLQRYNSELSSIFGASSNRFKISLEDTETAKLLISGSRLKDRLNDTGVFAGSSPVEERRKLLFDLGTILQYNKLSHLGAAVGNYARVCNPDKFGAKQTIFATNKVFDDIQNLMTEEHLALFVQNEEGNTQSFLSAIYPDVEKGLDKYMQSTNTNSAYPPLHSFLKYATATSIKINRNLFETQNPNFVSKLMRLAQVAFSGSNKRMTEKIYKDYQNYVLNYLYGQTDAVRNKVTYQKGKGFVFEAGADTEEERRRIFGYGKNPDLRVENEYGNMVEFTVADINEPTETEINQFATLSPAQKITWIQGHFRESGVFKYIRTTLFNDSRNRGKVGSQTIEFVEGNANIETIYNEFDKCFYNNNPLIALAALDIIKYGFAVEGFKMKKNVVNKVISNKALIGDASINSTGIVNQLNGQIGRISDGTIDMLQDKFIRSHSSISQIEIHRVDKNDRKQFELDRTDHGLIHLDILGDNVKELAEKYGFIYSTGDKGNFGVNKYVKLRFGKNVDLYKIRCEGTELVAYPLNLLEENETEDWSVNSINNKYLNESYYEDLLDDWFNAGPEATFKQVIEKHEVNVAANKFVNKNKSVKSTYATTFDINAKKTPYTGGFEDVISKTEEYFSKYPKGKLYLRSGALAKFIKHTGADNGSIQIINGKKYIIQKVDFSRYNDIYIGDKNANHEIKEKDPQIIDIIEKARVAGYKVTDAFAIEPYKEQAPQLSEIDDEEVEPNEVMHSSVTELGSNSMRAMYRRQMSEGDVEAGKALKRLHDKDITSKDASVKLHLDEVIPTTAEYVQVTVNKILNDLEYFVSDDEGHFHSVNEDETMNLIRNNPEERKRFLKTLLDARAFVRNYRMINELDIDSEDDTIRPYLTKIKEAINKLQNATIINNAEEKFANDYLAKLSGNPLIQGDIISLLDGYHSAGAFDAWVNDLQESSSPLLQIITKEVMGDIRAKEMLATKRVREFKTELNRLKEAAKAAGVSIDWKHIIDDNGKFVQDYNQAFLDKITELREAVSSAKSEFGEGSIEHLKAKFEYDKFKLNHVNQQLKDDYYQRKLELENNMITKYPTIYSAYQKLAARRRELLSHMVNGTLEDSYQEELRQVKRDIDNLINPYFYDDATQEFNEKYSIDDPANPFTGERKLLYSIESANALKNHLAAMRNLRDTYFVQDAKFGFDEELEKNLDTIANYEARDMNGKPTVPIVELMKHPDYVKAKEWVEQNARYVVGPETQKLINDAFKVLRENKQGRKVLSSIARVREAYDNHGVIDATKLTDEDIEKIRQDELVTYNIREGQPYSDRSLISNAPKNGDVFKTAFYTKMKSNGVENAEYIKLVNEINTILAPYYETSTGVLHTSEISEEDLIKLTELYDKIENTKKTTGGTNGKVIRKYIKNNVDFITNEEEYQAQKAFAAQKGARYLKLWQDLCERIEEGEDGNDHVVANRRIFGYAVPKGYKPDGTGDNFMVDKKKTDALQVVRNYTTTTKTEYYYKKYKEMRAKSDAEFNAWYEKNHIYNPYTRSYQPLQCWTRMEINPMADEGEYKEGGMWTPAFSQLESRPKDGKDRYGKEDGSIDFTNPNYKKGASTAANFKKEGRKMDHTIENLPFGGTSDTDTLKDFTDYSNHDIDINDYERQIKELFQSTLESLATTTSAKRYLSNGYMVSRTKRQDVDAKFIGKEVAKFLGWIEGASGREAWYEDIDYANDKTIDMPMMSMLKSKDSVVVNRTKPERTADDTDETYNEKLKKFEEDKKAAEEQNLKVHRELLDNDWEAVMEDFINKAAHFNAIQDNKYMLFYAKNMIDKLDVYVKNEGFNNLQRDGVNSTEDENRYVTKKDTRLQEQYVNWIRRLVYDQWKKPNNKLTRTANLLQSLASAKFMMLNVTGGIANVTVGETQIFGEVFAKEYFGAKQWAQGVSVWRSGVPSFLADMYKETSSSLPSAIVKFMNVVDFDELTGVVHIPDASEYIERARNIMFSPQAMGEHFMQNGAMFSMMQSHRLFVNHNETANGKLSYTLKNEAEFMRDANERALQEVLDETLKRKWNEFTKYETSDANRTKEYAWFRKDLTTEFANIYLNDAQKQKFIAKRHELQKKYKEEFNNDENHPTLYSQLKLGSDGKLDFKDDSIMQSLGDEAYQILGRFKGRIISVNKKIHGVYDKLGAAKWESYWWGGLVMQYHKHLYPGIMKRYRRQGYFNEERGTIEKGCYASIKDFLALPLHKKNFADKLKADNNMSDSELQAIEGLQNVIKNYIEFATHIRTNWNMLPEYERANIKRALGDMMGVMSALCMAIALRVIAGDDDDEGLVYNLFMYEADRLASESAMYNPFGLISEGEKLWSSPVAVGSGLTDLLHTAGFISQWVLQGDDFDPYYSTGLYAGENKVWVNIRRQIPMYHAINMVQRLERSNKYYKLGNNMLSVVPVKDIADFISK